MRRKSNDLSAREFRLELKRHGFLWLSLERQFSDIRARGCPRTEPVMRGARIDRRASLAALFADREARRLAAERAAAEKAEREAVAARLAPQSVPPARDTLAGADAIAQLADDFLLITTRQEGVTTADLVRLGWQRPQIVEHLEAARSLAYSRQDGVAA